LLIIGIAGGSGSGKTTFAEKVLNKVDPDHAVILNMDNYYLAAQSNSDNKPNFDHPNAFDWELLRQHIDRLRNQLPIDVPIYDYSVSRRSAETNRIGPCRVILFEGIFSLYDNAIREMLDIKCFLHVDADIRFTRRLHRDVKERGRTLESVISQYYETVRPMYQKYLECNQ
jgi:uridine kinase